MEAHGKILREAHAPIGRYSDDDMWFLSEDQNPHRFSDEAENLVTTDYSYEACERVREAVYQVSRCSDNVWIPLGDDDHPYRLANQELWSREWTIQEQYKKFLSTTDVHHRINSYPDPEDPITATNPTLASKVLTVNDTIPTSRFARFYAVDRPYDLAREVSYTPSNEISNNEPCPVHDEKLECWQLPEVEYCFKQLTKK